MNGLTLFLFVTCQKKRNAMRRTLIYPTAGRGLTRAIWLFVCEAGYY